MRSILITGCNRGIGLGLIKRIVENPGSVKHVFGTYRDLGKAQELKEIESQNNFVHLFQLDVTEFGEYKGLYEYINKLTNGEGLNVLINNAGISSKFTRIKFVKPEQMREHFLTNSIAPLMMCKALLPLLKQAASLNTSLSMGINRAAVVNMSSILGSITENDEGGLYPYRSSKAALNAITKSLSIDLKNDGILVVSLHPGWVKTDMGGSNADLTVESSVNCILNSLSHLNEKNNGTFIQYDGKELPW